jgi:hypothetical protein
MSKVIPMISSGIAGPLGVLHLPRLWQKVSLGATGKLHDDYPAIGAGFDQMVLDGLGINKDEFQKFVADKKPTYAELEAWVLEKKGGKLDQASVDKLNSAIATYHHSDATRKAILGASNVKDEGKILDAVNLNNLDDWLTFHKEVVLG